jgi:hypothetical protein
MRADYRERVAVPQVVGGGRHNILALGDAAAHSATTFLAAGGGVRLADGRVEF